MTSTVVSEIIVLLKTDTKYWNSRVYRGFPPQFNVFPVASVYQTGQTELAIGDGGGLSVFRYHVSVDIWTKDRVEEIRDAALSMVYSLPNHGIVLDSANTVIEGGVTHINLTFSII